MKQMVLNTTASTRIEEHVHYCSVQHVQYGYISVDINCYIHNLLQRPPITKNMESTAITLHDTILNEEAM